MVLCSLIGELRVPEGKKAGMLKEMSKVKEHCPGFRFKENGSLFRISFLGDQPELKDVCEAVSRRIPAYIGSDATVNVTVGDRLEKLVIAKFPYSGMEP